MSDLTPEEATALRELLLDETGIDTAAVVRVREKVLAFERARSAPVKLDDGTVAALATGERVYVGTDEMPYRYEAVVVSSRSDRDHPLLLLNGGRCPIRALPVEVNLYRDRRGR